MWLGKRHKLYVGAAIRSWNHAQEILFLPQVPFHPPCLDPPPPPLLQGQWPSKGWAPPWWLLGLLMGGKASSRHNSPILTIRHMHAWTHPPTQLCLSRPTFDDKTRPACGKKAAAGARKENCAPVIVPTTQTWTNLSETIIFFWTNNKSQLSLLLKYSLCLWTKNEDIKWKLLPTYLP